jgi:hypothetical protein
MERMPNYANNMPPSAVAGAYSGMPSYGMQPNDQISPMANIPPTYTSPAYTSPWSNNAPMYTSPAYTSPEAYPQSHLHSHMHYGHHMKHPVYTAAVAYGGASSAGIILVLFILLVIISRSFQF